MDRQGGTSMAEAAGVLVEVSAHPMGIQLVNSQMTHKAGDPNDIVEIARQVQMADTFVRSNATNALMAIAEQIKVLQEKAKQVLERAKTDNDLHHAACNLVKHAGTIYHLYERPSKQKYLSILSPQEWGASCPHTYVGGFRLENDQSWTPIEKIGESLEQQIVVEQILNARLALTNS